MMNHPNRRAGGDRAGVVRPLLLMLALTVALAAALLWPAPSAQAGKWHAATGREWWTVARVCRDGAVLKAINDNPAQWENTAFTYRAFIFNGAVAEYYAPVIIGNDQLDEFGVRLGTATVNLTEHDDALIYNMNEQILGTFIYGTADMGWNEVFLLQPLAVGTQVAFTTQHIEPAMGIYFVAPVEDCRLFGNAEERTPGLQIDATLTTQFDGCGSDAAIRVVNATPVYACLVVENTGDVTFTRHDLHAPAWGVESSATFTITPGTRISITHWLAVEAGLGLNLGPFTDPLDKTVTWAWSGSGEEAVPAGRPQLFTAQDDAETVITRFWRLRYLIPWAARE